MSRTEGERQHVIYTALSVRQVAERLGISSTQVYGLIVDGELGAVDVGRKGARRRTYMVPERKLEDFVERRTKGRNAA